MTKLYTFKVQNIETGEIRVIYGHTTQNVINDFWDAYVSETERVIIERDTPEKTSIIEQTA